METATKSKAGQPNKNKGKEFDAMPLSKEDIAGLLQAANGNCPTKIRNTAILTLLWRCGLRISECLDLLPSDIDASAGSLTVRHGKGNKRRTIGIDALALAAVQRWMDHRAEFARRDSVLFCTLKSTPVIPSYIRDLLPRLAAAAGIQRRVHAHAFRHSFACEMRREVRDTGIISKTLGHSDLITTIRYLDHVAPIDVIDLMKNRTA